MSGSAIEVGIGIPSMFSEVSGDLLLKWITRADVVGFSSLSTGERITFGNLDLLVTMAAAAAVTDRIRLMPTVLALPLHNEVLLAKQAASLDVLSSGRFVLGVGVSERPDDFAALGREYRGRGDRFEEQLKTVRKVWAQEPIGTQAPIGPVPFTPGGPPIMIGAFAPRALDRAGRLGDGFLGFSFTSDPADQVRQYDQVLKSWRDNDRPGRPRFAAGTYFALGPDGPARAVEWIEKYYGYLPDETRQSFIASVSTTTPEGVRDAIRRFEDAGADEVYFSPMIPELDQVDHLAEVMHTLT
jgi:alkanesulfonate monooxygenase SsuD/methylene tetrahydromethanopterin reductase-like flavin-dependent oxidoreductase (luciferase family)